MRPGLKTRRAGLLLIVVAEALWGTVFVASQVGLQTTNPYNLTFLRFFIAAGVILILMGFFEKQLQVLKELRNKWIWALGILDAIGFILQYVGQSYTSASEATLLANLSPILIPSFAFIILKEKFTKVSAVAMAFGLAGLILVASPRMALGLFEVIGDVLLFLTSICYAFFTVYTKKFGITSIGSSFALLLVMTISSFPVALVLGRFNPLTISLGFEGWAAVLYLGTACTAIALTIYLKGLGLVKATEAAILFLIQILVGLVLSGILLGEFLTPIQGVGAIAILLALAFGIMKRGQ